MTKNKFKIGSLFYNNKFVLVFSIVISTILWVVVSFSSNGSQWTITIGNIPINIQLSENAKNSAFKVFMLDGKNSASVSVTGSSLILSRLSEENIQVTSPQATSIDSTGTYELTLTAKRQGIINDFEIQEETLSPTKVTVFVDRYKEIDFPITNNIKYKTNANNFASSTKLTPDYIRISGPESIVSKISKVKAEYNISEILETSQTLIAPVVLYDSDDNIIVDSDINMLTLSNKNIQAEIPVLQKQTLPLNPRFTGAPKDFDFTNKLSVSPGSIDVAIPLESADTLDKLDLLEIDFSSVNPINNCFEVPVELPTGYKNLSNTSTAFINLQMDDITSKMIEVKSFSFTNLDPNKKAKTLTQSIQIEIDGPKEQIESLTDQNISAIIDLEDKENFVGHTEVPVQFVINSADGCWVYGDYQISVTIME